MTTALNRRDLLAVGLIGGGYALAALLLPPAHVFAYLDDCAYTRRVADIVNGAGFRPSEYAQSTLVTHAYWGALWAGLFGTSFTILTVATLVMSLMAALAFYALLRQVGCGPGLSGLGVALLALNPYYLIFSYSFMTEITFEALVLLGCLTTFIGLRADNWRWLWLGSLFAALAFLTRQFGLALPLAALAWLGLARQWTWRRAAAVALLPALALSGYYLWSAGWGPTYAGSVGRDELLDLIRHPATWVTRASHFIYLAAFLPGLTLPLWGRVRHWQITAALALGAAGLVYLLWQVKTGLVAQGTSTLDDLSYTWLHPVFANPTFIYCLGAALTVWLLAGIGERLAPGAWAVLRRRQPLPPAALLVLLALILFFGTYLVSAGFLDRYWLPVLPFLIAGGLVGLRGAGRLRLAAVVLVLLVVAAYGAAVHLDDYATLSAQWQGGRGLLAQGVPVEQIEGGVPWDCYYLYDEAVQRLNIHDIAQAGRVFPPALLIDPVYRISPQRVAGYQTVQTIPYTTRLDGLTTHQMLVLKRK